MLAIFIFLNVGEGITPHSHPDHEQIGEGITSHFSQHEQIALPRPVEERLVPSFLSVEGSEARAERGDGKSWRETGEVNGGGSWRATGDVNGGSSWRETGDVNGGSWMETGDVVNGGSWMEPGDVTWRETEAGSGGSWMETEAGNADHGDGGWKDGGWMGDHGWGSWMHAWMHAWPADWGRGIVDGDAGKTEGGRCREGGDHGWGRVIVDGDAGKTSLTLGSAYLKSQDSKINAGVLAVSWEWCRVYS